MDQFSAHLDRGWELVQKGDARGAATSAKRALELEPNSPEAHNLLGFVAAMEGESEEAITAYQQAIALDETYLEAMLNAAEVFISPLGDFDHAIDLCNQALDLAEVDEELIDALLLKFDALLGKGDHQVARDVLLELPNPPYENPAHLFLIGRAWFELGEAPRARDLIGKAASQDEIHPEAYYYLGLVHDEIGETKEATVAYLRAREIDLLHGVPPWSPERKDWERIAEASFARLSPKLHQFIAGCDVYISDVPGVELVADGVDPRALVVLDGFEDEDDLEPALSWARGPLAEGGRPRLPARSRRVFLYALNIARQAGGVATIEQETVDALEREISLVFLESEPPVVSPKEMN